MACSVSSRSANPVRIFSPTEVDNEEMCRWVTRFLLMKSGISAEESHDAIMSAMGMFHHLKVAYPDGGSDNFRVADDPEALLFLGQGQRTMWALRLTLVRQCRFNILARRGG